MEVSEVETLSPTLQMVVRCMQHQPQRDIYNAFITDRQPVVGKYTERHVCSSDVAFVCSFGTQAWLIVKEDYFPNG